MKVYEITVAINDLFLFYLREGKITLVTDPKYPRPCSARIWNKTNKTWDYNGPMVDSLVIQSYLLQKEDYYEWIKDQLLPLIEHNASYFGDNFTRNILIAKKIHETTIEVGMTTINGYYDNVNEDLQKYLDRMLKLKQFW